jgi:hypothetical protein
MNRALIVALLALLATACNTPQPAAEAPAPEAPAPEAPKTEAPKVEAPKTEAPKVDEHAGHDHAAAPAAGDSLFGAPFTMSEATPIGAVLSKPDEYQGKLVQVSGKVSSVCAKKGCWFVIQDPDKADESVRITMKDYGFFVPKDCAGKSAVIEGQFALKVLTEAERKHLAEDAGKDPSAITGDVKEYSLVATGVQLKP